MPKMMYHCDKEEYVYCGELCVLLLYSTRERRDAVSMMVVVVLYVQI